MPSGFLGILALVAAIESWLTWDSDALANYSAECWRVTGEAVRQVLASEVLCSGTSLSKHGVHPRVIQARTGKRAYNLELFSGPLPASYFLQRRRWRRGCAWRPS